MMKKREEENPLKTNTEIVARILKFSGDDGNRHRHLEQLSFVNQTFHKAFRYHSWDFWKQRFLPLIRFEKQQEEQTKKEEEEGEEIRRGKRRKYLQKLLFTAATNDFLWIAQFVKFIHLEQENSEASKKGEELAEYVFAKDPQTDLDVLETACTFGSINVLRWICSSSSPSSSSILRPGVLNHCLEIAVKCNRFEIVKYLIEEKDVSVASETAGGGFTILHVASRYGYSSVLKLLTEHVFSRSLDSLDDTMGAPICWASALGHKDCVEILLNAGANVLSTHSFHQKKKSKEKKQQEQEQQQQQRTATAASSSSFCSPATSYDHFDKEEKLKRLEKNKHYKEETQDFTCLHFAAKFDRFEIVKLLCEFEQQPENEVKQPVKNKKLKEQLKKRRRAEEEKKRSFLWAQDGKQRTAFDIAEKYQHYEIASYLKEEMEKYPDNSSNSSCFFCCC